MAGLRRRLTAPDGVLIATPEYDYYSVPGVLENAINGGSTD